MKIKNSVSKPLNISASFQEIDKKLEKYSIDSFNDLLKIKEYLDEFNLERLFNNLDIDRVGGTANELESTVSAFNRKPFEPEYGDLCRLHYILLSRRCISTLEFGSGYSTVVMADALKILSTHFELWARANTRVEKPFHLHSIDEDQVFLDITSRRLGESLSDFVTLSRSSVELISHENRFATVYSALPNISADFIYLDGPSQYATTQSINGFSLDNPVRMPMSADILRIEFFLEPGTLVLVDGRTSNARFLKSFLKRNWAYRHDCDGDVHYFELQEGPLGNLNKDKLDFCTKGRWLI